MIKTDLEQSLEDGPERIKNALLQWRKASLEREKVESLAYLRIKTENPEATATELKFRLLSDPEREKAKMLEDIFEAEYRAIEETHLSNKKLAAMRTAFWNSIQIQ